MPVNAASNSIHLSEGIARTHDVQFVVESRLVGTDLEPLHRALEQHLPFLRALQERGVFALGGPFFTEEGRNTGNGFYVLRVDSAEEARRIAREDPLHEAGVRTFKVQPWLQAFA